jgi:trehalose-6-phosphate synthase
LLDLPARRSSNEPPVEARDSLDEASETPDPLPDVRRRFAQTWASIMTAPGASDAHRRQTATALAHHVFGKQAEAELARIEASPEAQRRIENRRRVLAWLDTQFAELRADTTATVPERQRAVRRLLDEYLERIERAERRPGQAGESG